MASGPSSNLFVKGLTTDMTAGTLKELFNQYGTVTSVKILPQVDGKQKVAGFVKMSTEEEAQWIMDNVNGNIPQGMQTPVEISFAIDRNAKGQSKGAWGGGPAISGGGNVSEESNNLWIGGLPSNMDNARLQEVFSSFGPVKSCKMLGAHPTKPEQAAGMVTYVELEHATWVKTNVDGNIPEGLEQPVQVKYAQAQNAKGGGKGGKAMMMAMKGGWSPMMPCGNPDCEYLAHTNPELCAGFCCLKCEGQMKGEEWAMGGKKHYKHCEKRPNPAAGGEWPGGGAMKRTWDEGPGMSSSGSLSEGDGSRWQQRCANPGCEYLVHSNPSECELYCCQKCEGRHQGADWAMGGVKHYKQCEKRIMGTPSMMGGVQPLQSGPGFSSTQMMNTMNQMKQMMSQMYGW